jgi:hypothetical protein
MKWLKRFNESKDLNFEEIYDQEIRFIENSMINVSDDFDISYMEIPPSTWSEEEDCYYFHKYIDHHKWVSLLVTIRLNVEFSYKENYLELKDKINSKHPGLLEEIYVIKEDCLKFFTKNGTRSKVDINLLSYSKDCVLINISFKIKQNEIYDNFESKNRIKGSQQNLSERFKYKNITPEEIRETIKKGGYIYATIVKGFPNNDKNEPLKPVDIDDEGLITVEFRGQIYEVDIEDVDKVDISTNENTSYEERKDFSEMKYIDIARHFSVLKRQMEFAFYNGTWDILSYLWRSFVDPEDMKEVYKRLEEMEEYLISTIDKYKEIETKIEDINDRSASSGEFEYELLCIKPYGEWNEIADDKGSIFTQNQTGIKTQLRRWDAQFCIYIDLSEDIEGTNFYKKSHYEKIFAISELLKWIKRDFQEIEVFTARLEGKDKVMVVFSCR